MEFQHGLCLILAISVKKKKILQLLMWLLTAMHIRKLSMESSECSDFSHCPVLSAGNTDVMTVRQQDFGGQILT